MTDIVASAVPTQQLTLPMGNRFAELVGKAKVVEGYTLEKDLDHLLGVPFVITGITIRDGVPQSWGPTNYASVEIVIADAQTLGGYLTMGRLTTAQCQSLIPGESLVINGGGTGFCRQAVAYLQSEGLIDVGEGAEAGEYGTCRYDRYHGEWVKGYDPTTQADPHFDVSPLFCPRGLRVSEYVWDEKTGKQAATYYLG
jgi:hypothetical protein